MLGLWIQHWYKTEKVSPLFPGTQFHNPLPSLCPLTATEADLPTETSVIQLFGATHSERKALHMLSAFPIFYFVPIQKEQEVLVSKPLISIEKKIDVGKKEKASKGHHSKIQSIEIRIKWDYDKRWKSGIKQPTSPIPLACSWFFSCYKLSFWEPEQPQPDKLLHQELGRGYPTDQFVINLFLVLLSHKTGTQGQNQGWE